MESYLGFAAKSRNLVTGYNTCITMMKRKKIKLLIIAQNLAMNTVEKMVSESKALGVKSIIFGDSDELSRMTGNYNKGIYGITDENFANIIEKEIIKFENDDKGGLI